MNPGLDLRQDSEENWEPPKFPYLFCCMLTLNIFTSRLYSLSHVFIFRLQYMQVYNAAIHKLKLILPWRKIEHNGLMFYSVWNTKPHDWSHDHRLNLTLLYWATSLECFKWLFLGKSDMKERIMLGKVRTYLSNWFHAWSCLVHPVKLCGLLLFSFDHKLKIVIYPVFLCGTTRCILLKQLCLSRVLELALPVLPKAWIRSHVCSPL